MHLADRVTVMSPNEVLVALMQHGNVSTWPYIYNDGKDVLYVAKLQFRQKDKYGRLSISSGYCETPVGAFQMLMYWVDAYLNPERSEEK